MQRFKNILCVLEPKVENKMLLERAVSLAEKNSAKLTVVSIVADLKINLKMFIEPPIYDIQAALIDENNRQLKSLIKSYSQQIKIQTKVLVGTSFLEIIYEVLKNTHDLVIKSHKTAEWMDSIFASDDMHLLRKCPCPIWIIQKNTPKSYQNILATVDVDPNYDSDQEFKINYTLNQQILQMADSLAVDDVSNLHIAHVWDAPAESLMHTPLVQIKNTEISEYVTNVRLQQYAKLNKLLNDVTINTTGTSCHLRKAHKHLIRGLASKEIPKLAKQIKADLIVMGTVGRIGIAGFIMGNTAEDILNQIDCSVLAIKPLGFISPVVLKM